MGKRKVALALGLVGATLVGLCGVGLVGLYFAARAFSVEPRWQRSATLPSWAPRRLAVKIPATAHDFFERESGFQDPVDELIFELPPTDVPRFLQENHLERGQLTTPEVTDVPGLTAPPTATELNGLPQEEDTDAGYLQLFRRAQLWEWPGRTVIYLGAFST